MGRSVETVHEITVGQTNVQLTHVTKVLWKTKNIRKIDYLNYLMNVSSYMLPFLKNRKLTTIRFPNGIHDEKFYQKNCPEYAPTFIKTKMEDGIKYIICQDKATLLWLGNQSAIEFHIPFSTVGTTKPTEIVFDLDPPSRKDFHLAIEAALLLKESFDKLNLISFVKTSGNKGLQVYIPLPDDTFNYEQTRGFTEFMAQYLIAKEPQWFTTERLKVNRGKKLYVDYIQHAEGKTIIAPYSLRGNEEALVATPLEWKEVTRELHPEQFPIETTKSRLERGCPFSDFFKAKEQQPFAKVIELLLTAK
ncbi:non-homologous end-joining DNA ligase [Bacillus sp. Marseille-P3661]|uniref:non-homologous end-joining DNA ligase n=1 Tax=Bacillus sp. Marseille-P3661 TaxID=1936234 RepID=UPI0015E1AB33|nr:non-homologous end-joining DNA ligase [Bacillus sp. Marseille-P3661]